jgi:hypothetical protein
MTPGPWKIALMLLPVFALVLASVLDDEDSPINSIYYNPPTLREGVGGPCASVPESVTTSWKVIVLGVDIEVSNLLNLLTS